MSSEASGITDVVTSIFTDFPGPSSSTCFYITVFHDQSPPAPSGYALDMLFGKLEPGESKSCDLTFEGVSAPHAREIGVRILSTIPDSNPGDNFASVYFQAYGIATAIPTSTESTLLILIAAFLILGLTAAARRHIAAPAAPTSSHRLPPLPPLPPAARLNAAALAVRAQRDRR